MSSELPTTQSATRVGKRTRKNLQQVTDPMLDTERIAKLEAQVESIKEDVSEVKADIKEVHSRITTGNREIVGMLQEVEKRMAENSAISARQHEDIKNAYSDEIQKVSRRVSVLEQWKWYVIGIACACGYMIGHIDILAKFLK